MKIFILLFLPCWPMIAGESCCAVKAAPETKTTTRLIPRTAVVDQDGRQLEFTELIANRTVALNFIYTTCATVCPPMGANFAKLQHELPDNFRLISLSLDPRMDTPHRLRAWSDKFERGPQWTLLTGKKHEIEKLLKALGVFTPDKQSHAPILMVGSAQRWTLTNGLAPPNTILKLMQEAGGKP